MVKGFLHAVWQPRPRIPLELVADIAMTQTVKGCIRYRCFIFGRFVRQQRDKLETWSGGAC